MENTNEETNPLMAAPVGIVEFETDDKKDASPSNSPKLPVSVLTVPSDEQYTQYSSLFQCTVVVEKNKFVMFYELPGGKVVPVLMAIKQSTMYVLPKYHIFDISDTEGGRHIPLKKTDPQYLGKLRREKDLRIHAFSLFSEREDPLARQILYILYQLPSKTAALLRSQKPRKAQLALYHEESNTGQFDNTLGEAVAASMKKTGYLDGVAEPGSGLHTFASKQPYKKANGQYALNFFKRARMSNSANMQLEDAHGQVLIQLSQWEDQKFHLDFRAPFNAFQAFGFAIAQLSIY